MRSIKKSNLFTTSIVMLFIFSIVSFVGCEKDTIWESQYSEYLELETYEMSKMSVKDFETMGKALQRLTIDKKNGLYRIKQTSGEQVNISENLFKYIKIAYRHTNGAISHKSFNNSIIRLKSGNIEGDDPEPQDSTHCVSYAVAALGDYDYDDVSAYSDSIYGDNGIPADSMDSFFYNYYPDGYSVDPDSLDGGFMGGNMLYFETSDSTGHAVNGTFYDEASGNIMYSDPQSGTTGIVNIDDVSGIYYPGN